MSVGFKVALLVGVAPGAVWAQECRKDADCGHGFRCLQTSATTSSVTTGVGGSTQVECGDGICEGGVEDPDSCPSDCETISYCAPAECDSDADCADGYECGEEVGANSSSSVGGSASSVCGDNSCDFDEDNESCPEDCGVFRYCQPARVQCSSDADCAQGFYCSFDSGDNVSSVNVSSVDSGTNGSDTATDGSSSGSSGSDSDGTDGGFAPPVDTTGGDRTGVCLPESSDNTAGPNSTNGSTDGSATGADTGSTNAANNNGAGGANAVGGEGSPTSGSDTDGGSSDGNATGSDGGGAGGSDPDAGAGGSAGGDDGGCSCAVVGVPASSGFLGALLFGIVAGIRRRRTRS